MWKIPCNDGSLWSSKMMKGIDKSGFLVTIVVFVVLILPFVGAFRLNLIDIHAENYFYVVSH